jgi:dephospho-CoA kinase
MAFHVGLTGNLAAGKSTVAALFARWGATVIDADQLAREVQAPGTDGWRAISERFGPEVMAADGTLDRAALGRRVAQDPAALAQLNAIVHPAVRRLRAARVAAAVARGAAILVHDIPLLFEALDPAGFDFIVLVDAPESVRMERVRGARRIGPDAAAALMAAQVPAAAKRARSHAVIDNDGTLEDLERAARTVWDAIVQRAGFTHTS